MPVGFSNITKMVDAQVSEGKIQYSTFRKVPANTTQAGTWADMSMAPGNPRPNYYVGAEMEATLFNGNYGIYHGQDVGSSSSKHLSKFMMLSTTAIGAPTAHLLMDYLLFYSFIDMDSTDPQDFINSVSLPRYADGRGVKAMLVAVGAYIGGAQFYITYTNSDGVAGRVSKTMTSNTAARVSTLVTGGDNGSGRYGPFIALQEGDVGIRSVEQITFTSPNGGLAALVLVYPLANHHITELTAAAEQDFFINMPSMPRVYDGAYLNFITLATGSLASVPLLGDATFIWS